MTDKRELYVRLIRQGMSNSAACRMLEIDRKTGHWWKNGGVIVRNGVTLVVEPILNARPASVPGSPRSLSEVERIAIADGVRAGRSVRAVAADLGRAVSTVARELRRNRGADPQYRPHATQAMMLARLPPKQRRLAVDVELREFVQRYLDQRWSPEQIAHVLRTSACVSGQRRTDSLVESRGGGKAMVTGREQHELHCAWIAHSTVSSCW